MTQAYRRRAENAVLAAMRRMRVGTCLKAPTITDFIAQFEALLPPRWCADLVERFEASDAAAPGGVLHADRGPEQNGDKQSFDLAIPDAGEWAPVFRELHDAVSKAVDSVLPHFPSLQVYPLGCTGYKIQMYPMGTGHFRWHVDALGPLTHARLLALILYLNDVDDGGETAFHYQRREIAPRAGRAILFPTAWTHMHCGRVPQSGNKYVVTSFFQYRMDGSD